MPQPLRRSIPNVEGCPLATGLMLISDGFQSAGVTSAGVVFDPVSA